MTKTTASRRGRALLSGLVAGALALGLAGCGGGDSGGGEGGSGGGGTASEAIRKNPANAKTTITLGSKNFTEQKVLGEVYSQALEAAGYTVDRELNLGSEKIAYKAVRDGSVDAYPEYTGTALTSFFDVKTDDIPKDPKQAYELARTDFAKDGLTALAPTPFSNSNELGVTKETAQKLGLKKISDLEKVQKTFKLYGSPECRQRTDCLAGLEQTYGLNDLRKNYTPVDVALRHRVLKNGQADGSILFGTDPQIPREGFVLLEDDKNLFPPYNTTLVVRDQVIKKAGPDLQRTVDAVNARLDVKVIQELDAKVDLDKQTVEQAATAYLTQFGFVGGN